MSLGQRCYAFFFNVYNSVWDCASVVLNFFLVFFLTLKYFHQLLLIISWKVIQSSVHRMHYRFEVNKFGSLRSKYAN